MPLLIALIPYPVSLLASFYVPTVTPLFFILLGTAIFDSNSPTSTSDRDSSTGQKDPIYPNNKSRYNSGFTIIEMLFVILI